MVPPARLERATLALGKPCSYPTELRGPGTLHFALVVMEPVRGSIDVQHQDVPLAPLEGKARDRPGVPLREPEANLQLGHGHRSRMFSHPGRHHRRSNGLPLGRRPLVPVPDEILDGAEQLPARAAVEPGTCPL